MGLSVLCGCFLRTLRFEILRTNAIAEYARNAAEDAENDRVRPVMCSVLLQPAICAQTSILGFTPSAAAHEIEIESKFKAIPSPTKSAVSIISLPPSRMSPAPNATMN